MDVDSKAAVGSPVGSIRVVARFDFKTNNCVALKMVRNKKRFHHQAGHNGHVAGSLVVLNNFPVILKSL